MTKIKLCGLRRVCDVEYVNRLLPEYAGFVFALERRRYIAPEEAEKLKRMLAPGITPVGVFVNAKLPTVVRLVRQRIIGMVQLHGQEDEAYIRALKRETGCPVIKAFSIRAEEDIMRAEESSADYILLDSGKGGTGTAFDWKLLDGVRREYFLAGGLDPDSVGGVVAAYRPYAVDVSSGVETDGVKDEEKMKRFVAAVRAAQE